MTFANIYRKICDIKQKMISLYGTRIPRMARIFFFALRAEILKNLFENHWSLTAQK